MNPVSQNQIVVTVCMVTYNHADFIKDSIEGVLFQKTNFRIELLIGEDKSTDNTLQICREYEQKYPDLITVVYDGQNHGMVANTQRLMDMANGKYIAFSEGDDYWIDSLKLQKQVDILESNNQYAGCACQSRVIYEKDKDKWVLLNEKAKDSRVYNLIQILTDYPFQTSSLIFKTEIINKIKSIPSSIHGLDRIIYYAVASFGDIYWLKDDMAVYRKNNNNISFNVRYDQLKRDFDMIDWLLEINPQFPVIILKAHIYFGIIMSSRSISNIQLIYNYFMTKICISKSTVDLSELKTKVDGVMLYRLPKYQRKIYRRLLNIGVL